MKIARWHITRVPHSTHGESIYRLRSTSARGKVLGSYRAWDNSRSLEAGDEIARDIERKAIAQGYSIGEEPWNYL